MVPPVGRSFGNAMSVILNNDDRCAVDLILDRDSASTGGLNSCFSMDASNRLGERITRVEALLHLLNHHRAEEPSADLVSRTMARCDQAAHARSTQPRPTQPAGNSVTRTVM